MHKIRDGVPSDTPGLNELALACPTPGLIDVAAIREGDYFPYLRALGERGKLFISVEESSGFVSGTISAVMDEVFLCGIPTRIAYLFDLRVHPDFSGLGLGDRLIKQAVDQVAAWRRETGLLLPVILAVAAKNKVMIKKKIPSYLRKDWLNLLPTHHFRYSLFRSGKRIHSKINSILSVRPAVAADLEKMHQLWTHYNRNCSFGKNVSTATWESWMNKTAGVSIDQFLLALDEVGELVGFIGLWNQAEIRQMVVVKVPPILQFIRHIFAHLGVGRFPKIPQTGDEVKIIYDLHSCVPATSPEIYEALLQIAAEKVAELGGEFFVSGLDTKSELIKVSRKLSFSASEVILFVDTNGAFNFDALARSIAHVESAFG